MMYQAYEHKAISRSQTRKIIHESIEILNGIKKINKNNKPDQDSRNLREREGEKSQRLTCNGCCWRITLVSVQMQICCVASDFSRMKKRSFRHKI